jgi:hypothetical protein
MPTTAFLVRWHGGWREVTATTSYRRTEAMLSLGALQSIQEVDRVAGAELDGQFARFREQVTLEHRPMTVAEAPYVEYRPGDTIWAPGFAAGTYAPYKVLGMSIREDDNGELEIVPTVGDRVVGIDELQAELSSNPPRAGG